MYVATVYTDADGTCQHNDTTDKAGKGTKDWPWDIGHVNAIDEDSNGDYFALFRHLNEIMKIAEPEHPRPGSNLWRLGGRGNEFESGFNFSRQHMVRIVDGTKSAEPNTAMITRINNAWEGVLQPSAKRSSDQVIRLHTDALPKKAELVYEYPHPDNKLAESRSSM